ncbi:ABC transporter C family member 3 [Acorus gramineus]|uniref:ABC transporter C family member 3 n=1 Tax=Acorus gramineus TaxID=55184 RepID=A0AAV9A5B2_ACOGR|nr:ABC transporter C family member 3 [Acorus gramineus]
MVSLIFSNHGEFFISREYTHLLSPVSLHGFSAVCHLVFFLVLFITWSIKRCDVQSPEVGKRKGKFFHYRLTLLTSLFLALFQFLLCLFNYYSYVHDGWLDYMLATQLDLVFRTIFLISIPAYLHFVFSRSTETKFPLFLQIWWCLYLFISCCFLVVDLVYYRKHGFLQTHLLVLDIVSVLVGLILCYAGLFGKRSEEDKREALLQEPLLNTDGSYNKRGSDSVTPYATANPFSILTFFWMNSLLSLGHKKTLDIQDIPQLVNEDSVFGVFPVFQTKLDSCSSGGEIGTLELVKALVLTTWKNILLTGLFVLINTTSTYVGPYLIGEFVQYLIDRDKYPNRGYVLVSAFVVAKILECLSQRHWFFRLQQVNIRVRAVLVTMIYKKGLKLSSQSRQGRTSGEIINIMSVDADRIGLFSWYMHDLWMIPIQVILALLILYKNLGLASLATLAATILIMLVNFPLGKMQQKYEEKLMESKDVRMKATSEILRNMRILKLQGWEMKFLSKIVELRKNETNWLKKLVYTEAMTTFVLWGSPTFVSVVTFGACMLMGIPLDSGKVLSALATFGVLQEPIYSLPDTIQMVIQTRVSLDRISSFLRLEDLQHDFIEKPPKGSTDVAVEISDGNFSWDPSSLNPTLKDLNVQVLHGMRVAVCGTVGSGKSSLLSCILGEIPKTSGTVKLCGTTAYVAQTPWIQSGKIEDNVLFGEEMERERYERVLEACSLKKDLEILPFGDQTIIGERGINLSGGQKQRIQIARALYHGADIYLFDDPFSAVDAHTGSHLFKECLLGLLTSKTVIYVTHQMEFLTSADLILVTNTTFFF